MATAAPSTPDVLVPQVVAPELPFRKATELPKREITQKKPTGNIYSDKISRQQWLFIENYMRGLKPYEAAKEAGYAESTCLVAHDALLNHPDIQEEIQNRIDRYYREIGLSEKRIFQNALRFAESNLFDYGYVEQDGTFKVDLKNVPRELGYAIQEYSVDSQGRPRIKLVDKLAATALLAKMRGMGTEKVQLTGKDGAPLTIQALDSIVAQHVTINQQIIASPAVNQLPGMVEATK